MIKVAVLVNLDWRPDGGGHVKVWEHYARAAAEHGDDVDLTLHFQGDEAAEIPLAPNARVVTHRPALSTKRLPLLGGLPMHVDLSPIHLGLLRALDGYDVIHTTDAYFAYTRMATIAVRRGGVGLVNSIHTDTPGHTTHFTGKIMRDMLGAGAAGDLVIERLRLPERLGDRMRRRLYRHLARCHRVLVAERDDIFPELHEYPQASVLRRGLDKQTFNPGRRDRARLNARYGIPENRHIIVTAGRIDSSKGIMTFAEAGRALIDAGVPVHFVVAGEGGDDADAVAAMLGDRVALPGWLSQEELAWLFASADLFVYPSPYEIVPSIVLEAMACGQAPIITEVSRVYVRDGETGTILTDRRPSAWAAAIRARFDASEGHAALRRAALAYAERERPSWPQAFAEDLLPAWRAAAEAATK